MWEKDESRLAVLELYYYGRLHRRESQRDVWRWLAELPWTRRTGRRDELGIVDTRRSSLEELLGQIWPSWRHDLARLQAVGLPVTDQGWKKLQDLERAGAIGLLPSRLNRKTATAQVAPHSKASLSEIRREALADVDVTRDGIVRMRPNEGLLVDREGKQIEASLFVSIAGELMLSERALIDGTLLAGELPRAVLLVENLGPYLDLHPPDGWLVAHVPGWKTFTVKLLLDQLATLPIIHFGDLDPNGVRIAVHLRTARPDLRWAVPDFWQEYVADRALRLAWPEDAVLDGVPPLVRDLAEAGLWLEQETVVLDPRLSAALERALCDA